LEVLNAVFDTSPLIHLYEIEQLDLATEVFRSIHLPEHVEREIINDPIHDFIQQHPDRIRG
jgi:predicted nucleic acid-binding protein